MNMRLRIGSGFGIPIYLHWTFFLLPLWVAVSNSDSDLSEVFIVLGLTFACVVLHEFGHALTARYFGIATQDVTLYPIGGVARLTRMTEKPLEEILIAVAGPAVNVAIAIVLAFILLPTCLLFGWGGVMNSLIGKIAFTIMIINGVLLVGFNLLPVFPMDGGRVLRALLSWWLGHYQGTRIAVAIGTGAALLLAFGGIFYTQNYMLAVIAAFVIVVGQQELMVARMRNQQLRRSEEMEPLTVRPVWPIQPVAVQGPAPVFMFQPRISVYTWDNQSGTWRKEPGTLT